MEAAASSCLSAILSKIGGYLVDLCVPQANYLLRFKNNVEDLKKEAGNLRLIHVRVEGDVERAKRNTEEIEKDVEKWLMDVQNVLEEIRGLEVEIEVNKTFLCGRCPNWRWRYKLSRRAVKKTSEMSKLRESGNFSRVSHSTTLPGAVSYPKSRILKIKGIEATSLVAFKALCEKSGVEYLELRGIMGCCQNMVPSIDETGLNELKRLSLSYFDELECIIDMTQQQDVASTAFSNLVDLSLHSVGLREICSGGRPPRRFLENLETLDIRYCNNMSSLFPSWVLIQRLRKLKKVTVEWCRELEDVFQLEGLCYAKENPFLLSSLESLHLSWLHNLRYIWKGPTQQVSLQSLTVVKVEICDKLRYLFTLSLARSLLQLEELRVENCDSLEHIVEIKEAEENVGGGGGNDVMFPKLRILELWNIKNFINFYSENPSVNMQTAKEQLRDVNLLRHGLQNLEGLKISWCRVQVLFQLESVEQELSFPSLKVLELKYLEELEWLCKGPTHLLSLPNLKKLEVRHCKRLRHMFSPSLVRNLLQLEGLIIEDCGELEYIVSIKAEENVGGGGGNDVMLPKLRILKLDGVENFINLFAENFSLGVQNTKKQLPSLSRVDIRRCNKLKSMFPVSIAHLLSLQNLTTLELDDCHGLTHLFSSTTLVRNLLQLKTIDIKDCWELEQIIVEEHIEDDHVQLGLFPNLSSITVTRCGKLKSLFPVSMAHLLSLQNLTTLKLDDCHGLTHLFLSTHAPNLLQLESIHIWNCGELEQIIVEDDHVQLGLFPNLSSIFIDGCGKLKTLFPITIARSGLQKLSILLVVNCKELEQIIVEDHFIFPSLSSLVVKECPKITTRFSVDQNRSVHAEAKAPQTGKEDVDTEQSPLETTREIECWLWEPDSLRKQLPPYIGK
ncbi:hypothetical protein LWI29_002726 [Acer saccharum]|uniref:Disease resistance protein At4g27190-like leucine-rich repeats domain-containing protein n=1 Tax=Acer saccharum TaxID=4024 RepID=A0AA39T0K5_ACESA|nr:hypothetical protein LWI29_002726 [Acer saccharum]